MPCPALTTVKILGVDPAAVPHPMGELALNRSPRQVVVVVHKAIGVTEPVEPLDHLLDDDQKPLPVMHVFQTRQANISPGSDMIGSTCKFEPKESAMTEDNTRRELIIQGLIMIQEAPPNVRGF